MVCMFNKRKRTRALKTQWMGVLVVTVLEPKITEKRKNRNLNMSVFYDMGIQ